MSDIVSAGTTEPAEQADILTDVHTLDRIYKEEANFRGIYNLRDLTARANSSRLEREQQRPQLATDVEGNDLDADLELFYEEIEEEADERAFEHRLIVEDQLAKVSLAPAAYKQQRNMNQNDADEILLFPTIYGGLRRSKAAVLNGIISYLTRIKNEFRNKDRRCAMHIEKLFFSFMKKLQLQIISALTIAMKTENINTMSRETAITEKSLQDKLFKHKAYSVFRTIRNSPKYWEDKKKNINAMIRQIGPPTFFITFSPAETFCPELIRNLLKILKQPGENYYAAMTDDMLMALSQNKLLALVAHDPVTVARYIENRFGALRNFIFHVNGPFVEHPVVDKVWRTDFQDRGSPHCHMMAWCKDAPLFEAMHSMDDQALEDHWEEICRGQNRNLNRFMFGQTMNEFHKIIVIWYLRQTFPETRRELCAFVDKYVTCNRPMSDLGVRRIYYSQSDDSQLLEDRTPSQYAQPVQLKVQEHAHRHNCRLIEAQTGYRFCKYDFPKPILEETVILDALDDWEIKEYKRLKPDWHERYTVMYKEIRDLLHVIDKEKTQHELTGRLQTVAQVLTLRT